ncbi:MAG: hypothetical protein ACOH1P_06200 [Lysobacter sp.]
MPTLTSLSLAAALAVPLMLGGCGKPAGDVATEEALRAASGNDGSPDRTTGEPSVRTDAAGTLGAAGDDIALPDDFPADVYLPANRHVRSVMEMDEARLISVTTPGTLAALQDEASAAMRANGWEQLMVMTHEQARMLSFQKDRRAVTMTLIPAEDGQVQFNVELAAPSPSP